MKSWSINKRTKLFLLTAFAWTWVGWIAAYFISNLRGSILSVDYTVFNLWTESWGTDRFFPQLLFALAVYGPFIGFLVVGGFGGLVKRKNNAPQLWHYVILIPVISVIPPIILSIATSYFNPNAQLMVIVTSIILYFISNLITSGTEEFGWRGVLYPEMKSTGMSFWDIAWKGGIIWAVWHYPLMFIMYMPLGLAVLLPTLVGFTASIVAMNYITNFLYEKTQNIWAAVVLHALNNTMSFILVLLFPETPFLILTSLMAWVIVGWLEKKYPKMLA